MLMVITQKRYEEYMDTLIEAPAPPNPNPPMPIPAPTPDPVPPPPTPPTHELRVMGAADGQKLPWGIKAKGGDDKLTWDSDDPKQVLQARTSFEELKAKGYKLYKTQTVGGKKTGEPITEFDPNIERMIAVPPMQGG